MAGERRHIPASEFCASVRDGTHDSPNAVESGRKLVTSRHLTTGRLDLSDAYLISDEDFDAINKRSKVDQWDVLISMIGTVGEPCLIKEEPDFAIKNIGLFKTRSEADGKWLYYFLRSDEAQQSIRAQSRGTTQQYIPLGALRDLPVLVTDDPDEQKAIAAVLVALDDKIELNRRMNATLEAMARALFQSWFVEFDPVRGNLDSTRVAGIDKTTALLFPARLEDSLLGKVPVDWCVLKFADVLTPHSVRVGEESVPEFSATVTGLSSRDERFKKQLSTSQSKNKRIVAGDLVFGFSREVINFGLMREPVGAVSPVYEVFKIDSTKIEPELLERLFRFNMPYYMDILKPGAREGKPIDRDYLLRKHLLVPDMPIQRAFLATIQPWIDKIKANETESRTLATLRDALLPKLLRGELGVGEKQN